MNFQQIVSTSRDVLILAIGGLYIVAIVALLFINLRINWLHKNMESKMKALEGQGRGIAAGIIQGQQEKIRIEDALIIDKWERRRRLFLDLIPFIGSKS